MSLNYRNYWNTTTVAPNAKWVSSVPDEVNYLIIGAGGAGLSTALALAQRQATGITIIDPTLPGWRSARKQSGAVSILPFLPSHLKAKDITDEEINNLVTLGLWNAAFTEKFMWEFGAGKNWCEKQSIGGFRVAFQRTQLSDLEDAIPYLQELPTKPFMFTQKMFQNITTVRNGWGGLYVPNDFVVNPARYLNGLTTACKYMGVDISSGFNVTEIRQDCDKWVVNDEYGNTIKAKKLILCMGAFFGQLANLNDLSSLLFRRRIQYIATKPLSTRLPPYLLIDADGKSIYRTHNERVIYSLDRDDKEMADFKINKGSINIMSGRMSYRLKAVHERELKPDFAWSRGVLCTPDSLPFITEFKALPNIYLNMGYNEHSLSYQMIGGRIAAGLVLKGEYIIPGSEIFSLERVTRSA